MPAPHPILHHLRRARRAGCAAGVSLLLLARPASPSHAQGRDEGEDAEAAAPAEPRLNVGTDGAGFPEPFWLSLLTVVAGGAAGAAAANRLAGGGRRGDGGWAANALPTLVVGSTAAVVALTLNPPGHAWWSLAATAAAAGLGAEAVVLGAAGIRAEPTGAAGAPSLAASRVVDDRDGLAERAGADPRPREPSFDEERR